MKAGFALFNIAMLYKKSKIIHF